MFNLFSFYLFLLWFDKKSNKSSFKLERQKLCAFAYLYLFLSEMGNWVIGN